MSAPRRLLGSLAVFPVGLGCMGMSGLYGPVDEDEALRTLAAAVRNGATLLDTADLYGAGNNEELVGRAIAGHRHEALVVTKFGQVLDGCGHTIGVDGSPAYVRRAFEASARRLGVDHVDIYLQHRVDPATPIEETVGAMSQLVAEGKVGGIGLCEASAATIRRAHAVHPLAAVQSEYSLWWRGLEAGVLPVCEELGIGVMAYSPLGRGLLTGQLHGAGDLAPGDRRHDHPRFQEENLSRNLALAVEAAQIASEVGCEPSQLALAWLLAKSPKVVPIPGATKLAHLSSNLAATSIELDGDIVARLDAAFPPGAGAGLRYPERQMATLEL